MFTTLRIRYYILLFPIFAIYESFKENVFNIQMKNKQDMLTKKQVISVIKEMPDTFDTAQLFDKILLIKKVEEGRHDLKENRTYTTEAAREKLKKWLK